MLKNPLQKQKTNESIKCIKCGKNEATKEDHLCDGCRFMLTIDGIIKSRK